MCMLKYYSLFAKVLRLNLDFSQFFFFFLQGAEKPGTLFVSSSV